jgi:hypothetical protein
MTTTANLRARMRAWIRSERSTRLREEELCILRDAVAGEGRSSISGLPLKDMVQAASVVLDLQRRGLAQVSLRFSQSASTEADRIDVEVTEAGRSAIEAQQSVD